jgi:hypothetical protein
MAQSLTNILVDGQSTTIDLGSATLQEISISPMSVSSGGEIEVTSMDNDNWRSKAPKKLHEGGEVSFSALYDPAEIGTHLSDVGKNKLIKITFGNDSSVVGGSANYQYLHFYGWVDSFSPSEISEGEAPTADVTIIVSNQNGVATDTTGYTKAGDEVGPWFGTTTTAAP